MHARSLEASLNLSPQVNTLTSFMFFQVRYTAMGMQGWRRTMEDSHIAHCDLDNGVSLFGVFDGHGGWCYYKSFEGGVGSVYIFGCRLGWAVTSITNCLLCRSRSRPLGKGELQKGTSQVAKLQEQVVQGGARGGFRQA